jgi:tRNA(Ile)-lysidine synthase
LPVPDERRLGELLRLLDVRDDAQPVLHWPGAEVRRHQGRLLALRPVAKPGPPPGPSRSWRWSNGRPLSLPGGGSLALRRDDWGDVDLARLPGNLQVGTRAGAPEDLAGCDLKALLRESGIPAWERDAVPLLFAGKRLLAVADLWCHGSVMASPESTQRGRFVWRQR